jgi:chromosome segregation ATPase
LNDQVQVLCRALELKADEFGLKGGDMRSSLLYDLGEARSRLEGIYKSGQNTNAENESLRAELEQSYIQIDELRFIKETTDNELSTFQQNLNAITEERDQALDEVAEINEDRSALTNAIKELNFKHKRSENDMDSMLTDLSVHEKKVKAAEVAAKKTVSAAEAKLTSITNKYE